MKVGIVGSGFMGKTHIEAYKNCGANEFFVCDTNLDNAQKLANEFGGMAFDDLDRMLENVKLDVISICVPTPLHEPLAVKALKKGVAVLCEKPFAATVEAAENIAKVAEENNAPLMVAHCLRFMKPYAYLKNVISDGRFGKLLSLNMYRHSTMPLWGAGSWLADMEKSGGAVVDLHVHETDMAVFLLGSPKAVTTTGDYKQCTSIYHYDNLAVSAQASWRKITNFPFTCGFDANFENASVRFDGEKVVVFDGENTVSNALEKEIFPDYIKSDNLYENEIRYFIANFKSGRFEYCPVCESYISTKTVYAELESLKGKATVLVK